MSPSREALYEARAAVATAREALDSALARLDECLGWVTPVAAEVAALAPVVSIVDGKSDEDRTSDTSDLLAAARANPSLFPHVPEHLKRPQ